MKMTILWSHFLLVLGTVSPFIWTTAKQKGFCYNFQFQIKRNKENFVDTFYWFYFLHHASLSQHVRFFYYVVLWKSKNISLGKSHLCAYVSHKIIHFQTPNPFFIKINNGSWASFFPFKLGFTIQNRFHMISKKLRKWSNHSTHYILESINKVLYISNQDNFFLAEQRFESILCNE